MSVEIEIQEQLFELFEKEDDKTVVEFIESFVYGEPAKRTEISKLIEKFLEDNGLVDAYLHYQDTLRNNPLFKNPSQIEIINIVRQGLLSIAFNRLRNLV